MEQTLNEELQNSLNLAFSINYLVLDNFRHVDPMNHQGVFSRDDIFTPKSRIQNAYEGLYRDYAKTRNECFQKLSEFFDSYNFQNRYEECAISLVNLYNTIFKKNIDVNDVFSKKEIKNIDFLEEMFSEIDTNQSINIKDKTSFYIALNQFAIFYEQYKMWRTSTEIFEVLQDDITSHGSKSFMYGKPSNKNIFTIDKNTYSEFITPILNFLTKEEKALEKERKSLVKQISAGHHELEEDLSVILTVLVAIKLVYATDSIINKRFTSANKKPEPKSKINAIVDTLLSKYILKESEFTIDKIYIHKNEIMDLANALLIFPEFEEISNNLKNIALGSEHDLTKLYSQQKTLN